MKFFGPIAKWAVEITDPREQELPNVGHLWLVDPIHRTVEIFRLESSRWLLLATHGADERIRAEPFDAVELDPENPREMLASLSPLAAGAAQHQLCIRGEQDGVRDVIFLSYRDVMRAVRRGDWKLIRYPQVRKTQLFDLANDPHELHDLSDDPRQAEELQGRLQGDALGGHAFEE